MAQINRDKIKKIITETFQAIKLLFFVLFDHIKTAIDFVITKIDTKKTLTDANKAIIVSLLSYSVVFATGYNLIKKIDALNFLSNGYHNLSSLVTQFSHKSEPYIYDAKKAAELENEANELKKQGQSDQYKAQQSGGSYTTLFICTDRYNAGRNRSLAELLLREIAKPNSIYANYMVDSSISEICSPVNISFNNIALLEEKGRHISSNEFSEFYLVNMNEMVAIGVMKKLN
jgi:hypothetical protein